MKATGRAMTEGAGPAAPVTGEDLAGRSGLGRCELVRGRIVHASPTSRQHARVEVRIAAELRNFVHPRGLGEVLAGEAGIYTERCPDTVRGADVAFLSTERAARCSRDGFLDVAPDLVVEVLSPRDEPAEIERKIEEYLAAGVRIVWVADPARKTVRVVRSRAPVAPARPSGPPTGPQRPEDEVIGGDELLSGDPAVPGFSLPVSRFFD